MRDPRAFRLVPLLLALALLVAPLAGNGIDAQTATPGPLVRTPDPRRSDEVGLPKVHSAADALVITDLTSGLTAQQLANSLVSGLGVTISNVTYTGDPLSAGTFSGGSSIIGIDTGVILGSGRVRDAIGPNTSDSRGAATAGGADADLTALVPGSTTNDASVLEFDFVPQGNTLSFQYVFSSDEYNEFVGTGFNDVFGFFVNGANVALIPGTNTPVAINNVNQGNPANGTPPTNAQFYRNNDRASGAPINTEMDGLTIVLSVQAPVNPGVTNHIKLAIADVGDSSYDSNVFIKAGSFTSGCATMKLQPQLPVEPLGATFTVAIVVDAACDVDAAEAHLNFDPTKLQVVDASSDPGIQIAPGTALPSVAQNAVDNSLGRIDFAAAQGAALAGLAAQPNGRARAAVTGAFTLATITFRAVGATGTGGTPLTFIFGGTRNTNITKAGASVFGGATDGQVTIGTITATPTTGAGGPTLTPTATPTSSPTGAPTSSPTPTVFIPGGPVGGAGFGLSPSAAGSLLTWQGGTGQTGYNVLRSGSSPAMLPLDGPLPPSATEYLDTGTQGFLGQPFCYVLVPTGTSGSFVSDFLCTLANTRSITGAPQNFTIRLNQSSTASFTWGPPPAGDQTGYILFKLGELGGASAPKVLPANATSMTHVMQGPTCYVLFVLVGTAIRGNSDVVCAVPGVGNITGGATATVVATTTATPTVIVAANTAIPTTVLPVTPTVTPTTVVASSSSDSSTSTRHPAGVGVHKWLRYS